MESVPFLIEAYGGLAIVEGIAWFAHDMLMLEFRLRDDIMGAIQSGVKKVQIPIKNLDAVRFKPGKSGNLFGGELKIMAHSVSLVSEIPGHNQGIFKLGVDQQHLEAAQDLASTLELRRFQIG